MAILSSNVAAEWRQPGLGGPKHMVIGWPYIGQPLSSVLGSFQGHLGPFRAVLAPFGPKFALPGPIFGHFEQQCGRRVAPAGPWGGQTHGDRVALRRGTFVLGLGSFWGHLGPFWAVLAPFGPILAPTAPF